MVASMIACPARLAMAAGARVFPQVRRLPADKLPMDPDSPEAPAFPFDTVVPRAAETLAAVSAHRVTRHRTDPSLFRVVEVVRAAGRRIFLGVEGLFNAAFGDRLNPFYRLGEISFFLFWIVAVLALASVITVVQRFVYVYQVTEGGGSPEAPKGP